MVDRSLMGDHCRRHKDLDLLCLLVSSTRDRLLPVRDHVPIQLELCACTQRLKGLELFRVLGEVSL